MRDFVNNISGAISIVPNTYAASVNGTSVDLAGFEGATVFIVTGAITDGTHTFEVQESDDNSTFAAVADADIIGGSEPVVGETDDNKVYKIGYRGSKRYIRVASSVVGATTGGVYTAVVVKGFPRHAPVN